MHAAAKGHVGALGVLSEAGANLSIKDRHDLTAAMHAARQGHHALVARLEQAGANMDTQNGGGFSARGLLALFSPKRQK